MWLKYIIMLAFAWLSANIGCAENFPDATGGPDHLALTADVANASRKDDGRVVIPFSLKNNSDHEVILGFGAWSGNIDGLAVVDQTGKITFIENIGLKWPRTYGRSGGVASYTLKPGESMSDIYSSYSMDILAKVKGRNIFGVLSGYIANEKKRFTSFSTPFVVPPALSTPPYEDLGNQKYLSVTPDLSKMYFDGGSFKAEPGDLQRAEPDYADRVKNGWAQDLTIPIAIKNTSNQEVAVAIDEVRFYVAGNAEGMNRVLKMERWEYLKISGPILKPGESISSESSGRDYITIKFLLDDGYKPGDKLIAVVGGRIPNTNKIFECYSAPFELPPLPKGEPPAATSP